MFGDDSVKEGFLEPYFTSDEETNSEAEWYNDEFDVDSG